MFRYILQSRWFSGVILLIIVFFLFSIIKFEPSLVAVNRELSNINKKIDEAEKVGLELKKLGDYLKSDAYLERQARLKLNYKKPDEKVVFVYQNPKTNMQSNDAQAGSISDLFFLTNLKEWWKYLVSN
ncbi:MAG: septum formation initiator family protein [Candidatus Yanofskybacteria bacterium]|nr:septum formation initiator family protein [Candidatus Yanofskybacteria bacterium]